MYKKYLFPSLRVFHAMQGLPAELSRAIIISSLKAMSKTVGRSSPQTGKWESKELGASQGRKNHSAVNPTPEKGMEQVDQAERRSCLAER